MKSGPASKKPTVPAIEFRLVPLRRDHEDAYQRGVEIVLRLGRAARARREAAAAGAKP